MSEIKKCPICGSEPECTVNDMGRGNGHGYPGNFKHKYSCPKCGMITTSADDIYDSDKEKKAPERAIENWNFEVDKIQKYLNNRKDKENKEVVSKDSGMCNFVKELLITIINGEDVHLTEKNKENLISIVEEC